jgi:hypothetical protein
MSELSPLIEQARRETYPYVVVTVTDEGICWRAETQVACEVMADIIGNCKVMPREKFIEELEAVEIGGSYGS